ncbi:DNA cytosine methyltransferase [Rhizobium sp. MHM7A]|nr:DNA cytosine methyltransferase [Rhizobium sp. MHM7A]
MSAQPSRTAGPAISHIYTKIADHRGKKRLWLEGRKLERAHFVPGTRFSLTWDPETSKVVITPDEDGAHKVSRKERNGKEIPIIDVLGKQIDEMFGEGLARAKVTVKKGQMTIEVHPDDAATKERFDRLVDAVKSGRPITTGALAHGGGVIDHAIHAGLEDLGIQARLQFACEMDADTLDQSARCNPIWSDDSILIEAPMQEVDIEDFPKVDLLVAGLPCVGASRSGKSKNGITAAEEHPTAGALFIPFLRVVKHCNPSAIVLENVVEYANEISAKVIRATLETWGYTIYETTFSGNEMGALENRKRWAMIAVSNQFTVDLERLLPVREKEKTLGEVLQDVDPDNAIWKDISYLVAKNERDAAAKKGFSLNWVDANSEKVGTIGAGYAKNRSTEPRIAHPTKENWSRLLTPEEHAAVKTIPPELVEGLSLTLAHKILGNSCIWTAFRSVGRLIGETVLSEVQEQQIDAIAERQLTLFDLHDELKQVEEAQHSVGMRR